MSAFLAFLFVFLMSSAHNELCMNVGHWCMIALVHDVGTNSAEGYTSVTLGTLRVANNYSSSH